MNAENRLKHAAKIWGGIGERKEKKKKIAEDISYCKGKIGIALGGDDPKEKPDIEKLKAHYRRITRLEENAKEVADEVKQLGSALEDCVFGRGNYDGAQINFEDIFEDAEAREESAIDGKPEPVEAEKKILPATKPEPKKSSKKDPF